MAYERDLVRFLGWFSVGLGAVELLAPRLITRTLGTGDRPTLVRTAYGLREIGTGIGLLTTTNPAPFLWARIAGDAVDLATLGAAHSRANQKRAMVGVAAAAVGAITVLDVLFAGRFTSW
jgi:hypothetical protein